VTRATTLAAPSTLAAGCSEEFRVTQKLIYFLCKIEDNLSEISAYSLKNDDLTSYDGL
jgi:hypothetical protein